MIMAQPYNGMTPESVAYGRKYGGGLMQQGTDASPVGHWTQALARVLQGGVGGYEVGTADAAEREGKKGVADTWQQGLKNGLPIKSIAASLMGNPWGQEQGQSLASQALQTEASQGFQRSQQYRQFAQQMKMQQGSQAHAERMAGLQQQFQMKMLQAKSDMERQQLTEKAKALGLITDAPPQPPAPVQQSHPAAQPPVNPADPYQGLVNPAIPRAQSEAERKQKAAQAIMLGDEKGAVKILNKDEDPKEYQTKDAIWAERMGRAEVQLRGNVGPPDNPTYNPGRKANAWWPDTGFVANMTNSETFKNYQAGAREWIAALLRKDTGAAVTNTEWELYFPTYFPQPGDSAEVQKQKLERRVAEARKLRASSGGFFERMAPGFDAEMTQRMREQDARRGGQPAQGAVRVTSPDEARKLPSGTPIILPDGTQGRVP
jgi:hypothetical protein